MKDKKEGSSDILMSNLVGLELLTPEAVTFEKKNLVPSDVNLSMLLSISPQQLISVKAKLIGLREPELVTMSQFSLDKAEGVLVDEHGTVKITFWGDDIQKVRSGKTYYFSNLRLKKNKMNGELYVNPAKGNSTITEAEPFEKTLDIPEGFLWSLQLSLLNWKLLMWQMQNMTIAVCQSCATKKSNKM